MLWTQVLLYFGVACIMTVIIETVFFRLFGWRGRTELVIVMLVNVITNVSLNLIISLLPDVYGSFWLIILELAVVAAEYLIYRSAFGPSGRLLPVTFFANVLSFLLGAFLLERVFLLF